MIKNNSNVISSVKGRAIPIPGNDIDTDRIIPARYLKCISFKDLGKHIFEDERFDSKGKKKDHPLNDSRFSGAEIMIVNRNFGSGSSREHAPQGILRYGIKVILGESFADIFSENCAVIGLPLVIANEELIKQLQSQAENNPSIELELDFRTLLLQCHGEKQSIEMKESSRRKFLDGTWDSTKSLMEAVGDISKIAKSVPYLQWGPQNG